jgi:hypothetical protein
MPFYLDKNSGLPLRAIDNGDGTSTLIIASYGDAMLNSIAVFENPKLVGDVTLSASGGAYLQQLGNNIVVYAPSGGGSGGVSSVAVSGSGTITGAVTFSASGAVQLSESGQNIVIYAPTASGGGSDHSTVYTVGGTTPNTGTALDIQSPSGFGLGNVTTAQRDSLTPARSGVVVYNTETSRLEAFIGGNWTIVTPTIYVGSLAASGSAQLHNNITLAPSGAVQISQSGQTITVYAPSAGGGSSYSWEQENLTGTIVGGNTIFVLGHTPAAAKALNGSLGGVVQAQGTDYTMSGPSATFTGDVSSQSFLAVYPY